MIAITTPITVDKCPDYNGKIGAVGGTRVVAHYQFLLTREMIEWSNVLRS